MLSSWVRSIHCGTAAVVLAVVVSSGTGGGGLACVCFCCGSIFGSVTSPARGGRQLRNVGSQLSHRRSFQDITSGLSFTPQSYCLRAERQGRAVPVSSKKFFTLRSVAAKLLSVKTLPYPYIRPEALWRQCKTSKIEHYVKPANFYFNETAIRRTQHHSGRRQRAPRTGLHRPRT